MIITIDDQGRVLVMHHNGKRELIPGPKRSSLKKLCHEAERSHKNPAALYYFIVGVLKLPQDKATIRMINAFLRYGVTPEILLRSDLYELSRYVSGFGSQGVERLEKARKKYKK